MDIAVDVDRGWRGIAVSVEAPHSHRPAAEIISFWELTDV
jgi:hypothetical protein